MKIFDFTVMLKLFFCSLYIVPPFSIKSIFFI